MKSPTSGDSEAAAAVDRLHRFARRVVVGAVIMALVVIVWAMAANADKEQERLERELSAIGGR